MNVIKSKYIPLKKAAQKYYYTTRTLVEWVKRRHIRGIKQANKWWIDKTSLIAYLQNKESHD
jgi:hypothetical protein